MAGHLMATADEDRDEAHAELASERWGAHREKHTDEKELEIQKWEAHKEQHNAIARNLAEYKVAANEWRGTVTDLRSTFAPISKVEANSDRIEAVRDELKTMIATEREERREDKNLRAGAVNTWKAIAAVLAASAAAATIWALLNTAPP